MRSSVAQRLVSNLVASISSRSSLVLPSTPSAPEALWRPCLLRSWQPVRASAGLLVQHIGLRGLTGATAASCSYPHGWRASLGSPTTLSCWQEQQRTQLRQQRCLHASPALQQEFVTLNNLQDNEGARRWAKRVGRGIGSGKGKTAGRGHKGQKARTGRSPKLGFEGGQTPLRLRVPKRGFHNPAAICWQPVNLWRVQQAVDAGRLDPSVRITMRELQDSGAAGKRVQHGFKLLAKGAGRLSAPLHLEVSQASARARAAVEAAGGSVRTVYYNKLGLQALLKPSWFAEKQRLLPRPARPPPKLEGRFDAIGALPPVRTLPVQTTV